MDNNNKLINRLNRIEGQIRGLKVMLEKDSDCVEILTQTAAVSAALSSFSKEIVSTHLKQKVKEDIINGNDESVEEFIFILKKLLN